MSPLRIHLRVVVLAALVTLAPSAGGAQAAAGAHNTLTPAERAAGWRLLFDGRTLAGWRGLGRDTVPTAHWTVEDGAIKKIPSGSVPHLPDGQPAVGGDLMTDATYRDFELTWEWRVSPGGNSGVKYNVSEERSVTRPPGNAALGFEYQVLDDDRHPDGKLPSHRAGALYDLVAPNASKRLRPVGEWNRSRVVLRGPHGEHWLNGAKVVEYELGSDDWKRRVAASKFSDKPLYGTAREGRIGLQEHGSFVAFRNIKIREIK